MKIQVDPEKCQLHGQCTIAAPGLFNLDAVDKLRWTAQPTADQRADVEAAIDACPEQAISVVD